MDGKCPVHVYLISIEDEIVRIITSRRMIDSPNCIHYEKLYTQDKGGNHTVNQKLLVHEDFR